MTKLEAFALAVFSIIVMYGVFWGKAVYIDAPTVAQESDNELYGNREHKIFEAVQSCGYEAAELLFRAVGFEPAQKHIHQAASDNEDASLSDFYDATCMAIDAIRLREGIPHEPKTVCDLLDDIEEADKRDGKEEDINTLPDNSKMCEKK